MNTSTRIIINVITNWLATGVRILIGLFLVPFLLKELGREEYGLIGLAGVIVSMAGVADLGLRSALGRELAEQVTRKDRQAFNELASTSLVLYLGIASIIAFAGWILTPWFVTVFKVSDLLQADAVLLIRIYGTTAVIFSFVTPVFSAALGSYHRFDLINAVEITGSIAVGLSLFIVLPLAPSALWGWVALMVIYQVINLFVFFILFQKYCPGAKLRSRFIVFHRLKPLFKLARYMYILEMTKTLAERSDPMVISYFFGPAGVALYRPGGQISSLTRPIVTMMANQLYPLTTKHHIESNYNQMQQLLFKGTKFMILTAIPICLGMIVFAEPFCRLWLGSALGEDYRIAALILQGWAMADLFMYLGGVQWSVLLGMNKLRFITFIQFPAALLNLLISIWLVGFTSVGIPGVLIATIIINAVTRPIFAIYTVRSCGATMGSYFHQAYWGPLLVFSTTGFFSLSIFRFIQLENYIDLIIAISSLGLVWLVSCWVLAFDINEKALIRELLTKTINHRKTAFVKQ